MLQMHDYGKLSLYMKVHFNDIKNKNESDGGSCYMWPYLLVPGCI
jgi:hypothetical protein